MTYRKKLIEVALPLEAINMESAREKSIRHGHPSTLHLWWARRPLAACRAVLFASLVDDPSSHPDKFPTEEAQNAERQRLFDILGQIVTVEEKGKTKQVVRGLVSWDDINNPNSGVLIAAQREIARSIAWNRGEEAPTEPGAVRRYLAENAPPVYDPFAGGGSIPLEAQRLGLEAHGSDLNPVAVLITKALIEIPPQLKDMPPVNPEAQRKLKTAKWYGAQGLADDVRYYGKWIRDQAEKRIGHLYPKVTLPLDKGGGEAKVIAWLWARTVKCPNPACGCEMPLVQSFSLSTKSGKETWIEPSIDRSNSAPVINFEVKTGSGTPPPPSKLGRGAKFFCLACNQPTEEQYIKSEGVANRISSKLMATVVETSRGRIYLTPTKEQESIASLPYPEDSPTQELANDPRNIWCVNYGFKSFQQLFTTRQLLMLSTLSNLVGEVMAEAKQDVVKSKVSFENISEKGEGVEEIYAQAIATYLGLGISKLADYNSTLATWSQSRDQAAHVFTKQALPMVWSYAEVNPFAEAAGDLNVTLRGISEAIEKGLPASIRGHSSQLNAKNIRNDTPIVISTDPPYFDNISYADLSDFFYVWLRLALRRVHPDLFGTLNTPKAEELVASPHRFEGKKREAEAFFEKGLGEVFLKMRHSAHLDFPLTVFYAFKQSEEESPKDTSANGFATISSTGWETMLEGLIRSGFSIHGTLPMRTERGVRSVAIGTNALASSIVLVCRPRPENAASTTRRRFVDELKFELPDALKKLQQGNIAPVDLAQASIGPGMAVFSRYVKVLESDGSPMRVRTALQLINQTLDEFLTAQEGEFDADTRWALAWFEQYQFNEGQFGDAETLSKAKNTSIKGMAEAGILTAKAGKVQLVPREALPANWNPAKDNRIPVWEATQHLIRALDQNGETGAAHLLAQLGNLGEVARDLAYRLYSICDRKGWTQEAIAYNSLVISWSEIARLALEKSAAPAQPVQGSLEF